MFSKKWVLSTFILFSLLVVLSQVLLQSPFVSEKIKDQLTSQLEQILKKEVSIGHVEISLLSSRLSVKEISIQSDSTLLPSLLSAKEIKISFSPVSFFTETFLPLLTLHAPSSFTTILVQYLLV